MRLADPSNKAVFRIEATSYNPLYTLYFRCFNSTVNIKMQVPHS